MKRSLADFNLLYSLLLPVVQYGTRCHYRQVVIRGQEQLPKRGHYILAPCHQCGMMDPLLVLLAVRRPVVFLARADMFRNPVARFFLSWLRIGPIYRIRDGRGQLERNQEVFAHASQVLQQGMPLCLMAEGTHNNRHQLLPLGKGLPRIALETQRALGDETLYIVPVGIDYEDYEQPYTRVVVDIGQPIAVKKYWGDEASAAPIALNRLRQDLTDALRNQMHHVGADLHYADEYAYCYQQTASTLQAERLPNNAYSRFAARRVVSQQLASLTEEERQPLYDKGAAFANRCCQRHVPLWAVSQGNRGLGLRLAALAIVLLAIALRCPRLFLLWVVANPIALLPTSWIVRRKVKDTQFRSTANHGLRFGLTLLWIIALFVGLLCMGHPWQAFCATTLGIVSARLTPQVYVLLRDLLYALRWHSSKKLPQPHTNGE